MAPRAIRGECYALTIRRKLRLVVQARGRDQLAYGMGCMRQIHVPNVHIDVPASVSQTALARDCRCGSAFRREPQPPRFRRAGPKYDLPQTWVMEVSSAEHDRSPVGSPSRSAYIEVFKSKPLRSFGGR